MKITKATIRAYLLGLWEFRRMVTTSFETQDEYVAYDRARDFAHWATFRYWDSEAL